MKKYFYIGIACFSMFTFNSWVQAQNIKNTDPVVTKTIDWAIVPGTSPINQYIQSKKCGSIKIDLPKWVEIYMSTLEINKKFPHDLLSYVKLNNSINFTFLCETKVKFEDTEVFFNKKTQQWELKDQYKDNEIEDTDRKTYQVYQLKAKNASGWLRTGTFQGDSDDHGNYDYMKNATFCLINDKQTKEICGNGDVQFIPNKKDLGTKNSDYTPMLIQFLQTLKFEDDK